MTAHVVYPAIDDGRPRCRGAGSPTIVRGELGFAGVIVSDDLDMKAVPSAGRRARSCSARSPPAATASSPAATPRCSARPRRRSTRRDHDWPALAARVSESAARVRAFRSTLRRFDATSDWRALPLAEHEELAARAR